jgi:arginine deiminase
MKFRPRILTCLIVVLLFACGAQEKIQEKTEAYVPADIAPLKKVIVLSPGEDFSRRSYEHYSDRMIISLIYDAGAAEQHRQMVDILEKNGAETLHVIDLLDDAIAKAREAGRLEQCLKDIFPSSFQQIRENIEHLDARALLGRNDLFYYHYDPEGRFLPLIKPTIWFYYTRDFAAATPKGLILTNSKQEERRLEHAIGRFMFEFAAELKDCTIAFDAEKEGVRCEGGDIIVKDKNTILMGIHNMSEAEAAQKIAWKLNLDVLGVSMPPYEDFSGTNIEIMHLDTVFNLVDEKKALTVPYLFEKEYAESNPIVKLLESIHEGITYEASESEDETDFSVSLSKAIKRIPAVGWLTRYEAGTGEAVALETKLVDFLRDLGYEIIWVGGKRNDLGLDKYLLERVMYELSMQAANVVQLGPGKVIAYAHNRHTIQALRENGIEVLPFEGKYLADNLGGPHCLTMPLLRRY